MARGGFRPGAGRPKGTTKIAGIVAAVKKTEKAKATVNAVQAAMQIVAVPEQLLVENFPDSLSFLRACMNCPALSVDTRKDAAKALAPYEFGKKADAKVEAPKREAAPKFAAAQPPKLVARNG
jgi:phage terminase small subunit